MVYVTPSMRSTYYFEKFLLSHSLTDCLEFFFRYCSKFVGRCLYGLGNSIPIIPYQFFFRCFLFTFKHILFCILIIFSTLFAQINLKISLIPLFPFATASIQIQSYTSRYKFTFQKCFKNNTFISTNIFSVFSKFIPPSSKVR